MATKRAVTAADIIDWLSNVEGQASADGYQQNESDINDPEIAWITSDGTPKIVWTDGNRMLVEDQVRRQFMVKVTRVYRRGQAS